MSDASFGLHDLAPPRGARKHRKRVGRGRASGKGKTSGRGQKGQGARPGGTKGPPFEGGQTPLVLRMAKRGFRRPNPPKRASLVNLAALDAKFDDGSVVDPEALAAAGLARRKRPVKILGKGALSKKLHVVADAFSQSAREAIARAGGTAEVRTRRDA